MKCSLLLPILLSTLFIGCGSHHKPSETLPAPQSVMDTKSAKSYALYQQNIEKEINRYIDSKMSNYTSQFLDSISDTASSYNYTLSKEERQLVLDGISFNFKALVRSALLKKIHHSLDLKYRDTLKSLKEDHNKDLDESQKALLADISDNYFEIESIANAELEEMANKVIDQTLNAPTLVSSQNGTQQHTTFEAAKSTAKFNKLMGSIFGTYQPQKGDSIGNAIDGGALHGNYRVSNRFKRGEDTLYINEPTFEDGKLVIDNTTKTISYPGDYELSTAADLNGDGYENLIIESCKDGTLYFSKLGSKVDDYNTTLIFTLKDQICHHTTDFISGDFDGDNKDELALGTNKGVLIFDDADNNFTYITKFTEKTGYKEDNVYRLASGNTAGKNYDDLAVVVYNKKKESKFKAMAFLFEMSGMQYLPDNYVKYNYQLYTLNKQTLDYTTPADVVIGDFELFGRLNMYVLQLTDKEESKTYGPNKWKERHDASGFEVAFDNHWCTYSGYFKNYVALWRVSQSPSDPVNQSSYGMDKVNEISITNRISSTYVKPAMGCHKVEDLSPNSYGILFSIRNPIQAVAYKSNTIKKDELSKISLNGIPLSFKTFEYGYDYEISGLYDDKYYSAGSKDAEKPNLAKTNYKYEDINNLLYNYVNTYIENPKHESYFDKNSSVSLPSHSYGNREEESFENQRFVFVDGNNSQKVITDPTYYNDSMVMVYKNHSVFYTDPQAVIYISAPPVKAGQITSFTYSTGACSSTEKKEATSNGFTAGLGILDGGTIGGSILGAEIRAEILGGVSGQFQWTKEHSAFNASSSCQKINSTVKSDYSDDTNLSSSDLVQISSHIIDTYTYMIVKDLNNSANIGKDITVNITRNDSENEKIKYSKWMNVSDYLQVLQEHNRTAYVDFSSLVTHIPGQINTYLTLEEYNTLQRDKHNTSTNKIIYKDFSRTPLCQIQQDKYSNVDSYQYSLTSTNGNTKGDGYSQTLSAQSLMIFRAGFIFGTSGRIMLNAGWTHKHTVTYSSSTSESASYQFSASGATTKEPTDGSYNYGAFTYSVSKKGDKDKAEGDLIKIIDFYIDNN